LFLSGVHFKKRHVVQILENKIYWNCIRPTRHVSVMFISSTTKCGKQYHKAIVKSINGQKTTLE